MAPPPSTAVSPVVSLVVRLLTIVCLVISLGVLASASYTDNISDYKVKSTDVYAYRYLLAATVIGLAYTLLQAASNVLLISTGNRPGGESMLLIDFYGDKVITFILATGAAASFGLSVDFKRIDYFPNKFLSKAEAASSLCLLGSLFALISSIFSSFALPKTV